MSALKLSGALLIVLAGWFIGFSIAEKYRLRPVQLRSLQSGLLMLQTEISYTATPLPEALSQVAERCDLSVRELFKGTAQKLMTRQGFTAAEAWNMTLKDWQLRVALIPSDVNILRNLGSVLGTSSREEQEKHLLLAREQLRQEEIKAEQERNKNETLWKYTGVLTSLLIVIILY
ncbi:MAG: stage III sporulation protein SpoIIIAB [Bacillota bacterium]|jgi:stage III sporulation protein AB